MRVRVQKWGNSLALRIPKSFAEESDISEGTAVNLSLIDGKITISPIVEKSYTLDQLLGGVTRENLHHEVHTGPPVGKEVW